MWSAVGAVVLKTVVDTVVNGIKPNISNNTSPPTEYHHSGTHRSPSSSSNAQSFRYSDNASSCQNCSGHPSKNANGTRKRDNTRKRQDNSKFCFVQMPEKGNVEINIKKTETEFANMSMQSSVQKNPRRFEKKPHHQQKGTQNSSSGMKTWVKVDNANLGGRNHNKVKLGSQNNGKPLNKGAKTINQKPNLSNQTTWMYVGRLKRGTTEADLRSYLTEKFPGHKFIIEQLPLYKDAKLPCFKIRVDNTILEAFQQPDHWPDGVTIITFVHNFVTK